MDKRGREGGRKKQVQREGEKEPWEIEPLSRCLVQGRGACAQGCVPRMSKRPVKGRAGHQPLKRTYWENVLLKRLKVSLRTGKQ